MMLLSRLAKVNIPENSLLAFQYAYENGADGIEIDISLTLDHEIVVMHDGTVDRTCVGTGEVSQLTFKEINSMKYRPVGDKGTLWTPSDTASSVPSWPPTLPSGHNLYGPPSLSSVIKWCKDRNLYLMIESKEAHHPRLLMTMLSSLYLQDPEWMYSHSYIASFNPYHIYILRTINPSVPVCLLYCASLCFWYYKEKNKELLIPPSIAHTHVISLVDLLLLHLTPILIGPFLGLQLLGPHNISLMIDTVRTNNKHNVTTDVWVVNRKSELELWKDEECIVTTDCVFPSNWKRKG